MTRRARAPQVRVKRHGPAAAATAVTDALIDAGDVEPELLGASAMH